MAEQDGKLHKHDLSRRQIMRAAKVAMMNAQRQTPHGEVYVLFRYSCEKCGTRCTFNDKNRLPLTGQCFRCGYVQNVKRAGFMLMVPTQEGAYGVVLKEGVALQEGDTGADSVGGPSGTH